MKRYITFAMVMMICMVAVPVFAQAIQNVEVHGYMQNRLYFQESSSATIQSERVSISALAKIAEVGNAYVEYYFMPAATGSGTYLESAYVDLEAGNGRVRVGKGRQLNFGMTPSYPNRKTTQYGIVAETFTQPRIVGAQYTNKLSAFDYGVTLYNDYRASSAQIGQSSGKTFTSFVSHVVNGDVPGSINKHLAVSGRFGITKPCFSAHLSGSVGKFEQIDANFIGAIYGMAAGANTDRDHNMYGADATYSFGPCVLQGEWYHGNFSFLGITGWQVLAGYQPKDKTRFYARYSTLNNDRSIVTVPTTNDLSRDTQQLTLGIVQPISKGIWVETNYEHNTEYGSKVKDDLFFVELFTGF
ncbi:MAG: hypothetical protein ABFD54_03845 [Armatimonadota bacterium]|nr:hypothetical protein [bacterium]